MMTSTKISSQNKPRRLEDLISIGPAMLRDFQLLGIGSVTQLAHANPHKMYKRLCELTGRPQDLCCLDVFQAAVAQARNPKLPPEKCVWWYWSQKRKARRGKA